MVAAGGGDKLGGTLGGCASACAYVRVCAARMCCAHVLRVWLHSSAHTRVCVWACTPVCFCLSVSVVWVVLVGCTKLIGGSGGGGLGCVMCVCVCVSMDGFQTDRLAQGLTG